MKWLDSFFSVSALGNAIFKLTRSFLLRNGHRAVIHFQYINLFFHLHVWQSFMTH